MIAGGYKLKAIVVGAGLAGSSAAFILKRAGYQVKIIESTDQVGGRANTVTKQGYLIDTGCSAMTSAYTSYLALTKEAGVADRVAPASPCVGFVRNDTVFEFDTRHMVRDSLFGGFLSLRAKFGLLKLFRDVFSARAKGMLDFSDLGKAAPIDVESVSAYAQREFSREINDHFCDPLVRPMLLANADQVSKVEFFSLIANYLDARMCSMRGGQQGFAQLLAKDVAVEFNSTVSSVRQDGAQVEVRWSGPQGESAERADACVVACHLDVAADICADHRAALEPLRNSMRYTKAISVAIGASILVPGKSFVVFVPYCEERHIATLFLEHNKCEDRAPTGHSLFTAYLEADASEASWHMSDEQIVARTLDYLYRLYPMLRGAVDMSHVKRWDKALPLMKIGGYGEVARLNQRLDPAAPVQFAGDYLSGAGQNTAVDFGVKAAKNIINHRRV
jgi:oxygen-dependent protoporphyrinogen oxidase